MQKEKTSHTNRIFVKNEFEQMSIYPHTNKYLNNLFNGCERILCCAPPENLNIKSNGNYTIYNDESRLKKYISKDDKYFVKYVEKYCAQKVLYTLKRRGNIFDNLDIEFARLEKLFGKYTPSFCKSRETIIKNWINDPYKPNPYNRDDERNFKTRRGDLVRSKTEYIAAEELFAMGIPYKMEMPVKLKNRTVYPDFTIIDPFDGCIFYIELCGMMQNPEYAKNSLIKINDYAAVGITVGKNLIIVLESSEVPFNIKTFRSTLVNTLENSRRLWKLHP